MLAVQSLRIAKINGVSVPPDQVFVPVSTNQQFDIEWTATDTDCNEGITGLEVWVDGVNLESNVGSGQGPRPVASGSADEGSEALRSAFGPHGGETARAAGAYHDPLARTLDDPVCSTVRVWRSTVQPHADRSR